MNREIDINKIEVVQNWPPNIEELKKHFPMEPGVIFAYKGKIYNPFNIEITLDLMIHEATHFEQQGEDTEGWYEKYINDKQFRFEQELQAYAAQYEFLETVVNNKILKTKLFTMAELLSGPLYGNMIPFEKAESAIRHYRKLEVRDLENEKNEKFN